MVTRETAVFLAVVVKSDGILYGRLISHGQMVGKEIDSIGHAKRFETSSAVGRPVSASEPCCA